MTELKTLEEFNEDKRRKYEEARKPRPNGITCPECGAELMDSYPCAVTQPYVISGILSGSPSRDIHCPACDYRGYRME